MGMAKSPALQRIVAIAMLMGSGVEIYIFQFNMQGEVRYTCRKFAILGEEGCNGLPSGDVGFAFHNLLP